MRPRLSVEETMTASELCERSGLRREDLQPLVDAGLLRPLAGGRYKPRNLPWAEKLADLLAEGWTVPEIKAWTLRRWQQPDPRVTKRGKG